MNTEQTDTRQHIIDAAQPIILGKGFSAAGLNELLGAAAVPKGSFYHYFKSKESFGEALLDSYFADYLQRLDALLEQGANTTAAQRLMGYWTLWRDTQASDGPEGKCLVVKLGGEVSDLSETMRVALEQGTDRIIQRLAVCIGEGIADGSLPDSLDARHTAQTLYQMWLGATLLAKIRQDQRPLADALAATLLLLQCPDAVPQSIQSDI
jgi:TetR/AcrR family transcriptional repressor of nem operon